MFDPPSCDIYIYINIYMYMYLAQCMGCTAEAVYQLYYNINCNAAFPVTGIATSSNHSSVFWTLSHCWQKNQRAGALKQYGRHVKHCTLRCVMESVGGVPACEAQTPADVNEKHLQTETPHCCQKRHADVCRCAQMCSIYSSACLSACLSFCSLLFFFFFYLLS